MMGCTVILSTLTNDFTFWGDFKDFFLSQRHSQIFSQGTSGSQVWDTSFAALAFLEVMSSDKSFVIGKFP